MQRPFVIGSETSLPRSRSARRRVGGFALVITLSLMILLTLLAVGLLSLSAVSLRGSSHQALQLAARGNARLSMMMALGELQRLAGSDQRITANSDLLDSSPLSEKADGVSQPHLAGVWKSWKQEPLDETLDYDGHKEGDFLGWLVSAPDRRLTATRKFVQGAMPADAVTLVGEGVSAEPTDQVRAATLSVKSGNFDGKLAWAVLDQGQKAMVALPDGPGGTLADELAAMTAPALPNYDAVESRNWGPLAVLGEQRPLMITQGEFQLGGVARKERTFHDLTASSLGLPVDVTAGRFASDLSLLFDSDSLPADYSRRFLYSDTATPLAQPPGRFRGAYPLPSPDPSWRLLQSHARMHTSITSPTQAPATRVIADQRPPTGTPAARLLTDPAFTRQQLAPVIARAQFVFSVGFGASPDQARGNKAPGQQGQENWICWLVTDPVVTLWNPYNVSLSFTDGMVELYRVPLAYQLFRNGTAYAPATLFTDSYLPGEFATRATRYYRLNLKPKTGQRAITLKPGEHMVFTAHNHVKHYQEAYYKIGVDLQPGWNEPAGERSNKEVGGISSLNTYVSTTGTSSGKINGATARSLPVKAGDRITLKISAAKAGVDKFAETNNQEVSAMLRYRINTGSSSPGSVPPLVGAIELDYGRDENKLLRTYDQRDLPTVIVPGGIPTGEQGDNYAGSKPPPAVRYKEPFLVASLNLKTARDSRFPSRGWIHNSPWNLYATAGIDQAEDFRHHQYELNWEPMTDWKSTPTIEIDPRDRGFGGSGIYSQSGQNYAVYASLPISPLLSIGQLSHAPINAGGQLPLQGRVVGNSFAHPLLRETAVRANAPGGRTYLDHSWLANQGLFDRYFFSGAGAPNPLLGGKSATAKEIIPAFFKQERLLANPRMRPLPDPVSAADPAALADSPENFREFPASLGIAGAFNINSTSVAAWEAILASVQLDSPSSIQPDSGALTSSTGDGTMVTRHVPPLGQAFESSPDPARREELSWVGYRKLTQKQISQLATAIVTQVKQRGPFQSQAEFVNRRLETGELSVSGALQAAIDASGINRDAQNIAGGMVVPPPPAGGVIDPNPAAAQGNTADGATAVISQADLLTPLAPFVSARSDTFVIRAYGEARSGTDVARVWCEAVVQRTPDYVNPTTPRTTAAADLRPGSPEMRFGRRFAIVSFRWLPPAEV